MKCDYCKINDANTHIKTVINGTVSEVDLCPECAAKQHFPKGKLNLSDFLFGPFNTQQSESDFSDETRCNTCGATFSDIVSGGMVGCPQCYNVFYAKLAPTVKKAHGRTRHYGKIPLSSAPRLNSQTRIETLKKRMKTAVETENFELAAKLRDTIKQLEGTENE